MRLLDLNTHLTRESFKEVIPDPIRRALRLALVVLTLHVHRGAHVHRAIVVLETVATLAHIPHITINVTRDLARVSPQLLEQLVRLHQVDEGLEALALLVDLLVLAAVQELLLDFVEELILVRHDVEMVMRLLV